MVFRRARGDEADVLGDLTIRGVSYWGHDVNFPELVEDLRNNDLPTAEYIEESPVYVLEEGGERIGFYGLEDRGEHVELRYMFLGTDHIGRDMGDGCGTTRWPKPRRSAPRCASCPIRERLGFTPPWEQEWKESTR